MKKLPSVIIAGGLAFLAGSPALLARHHDAIADNLSGEFVGIVGSQDNARELITGLRDGSTVRLTGMDGRHIRIHSDCGRMGWGNAYIVLALAQEEFQELGIMNPSVDQLEVVLDGGTLVVNGSPRQIQGILPLCASAGDDWNRVAMTIGVSFAPVRDHWRSIETRFDEEGGKMKLDASDRPKGEDRWGQAGQYDQNAQYQNRNEQGGELRQNEDRNRDEENSQFQNQQNQDQLNQQSQEDQRQREERDQNQNQQYQNQNPQDQNQSNQGQYQNSQDQNRQNQDEQRSESNTNSEINQNQPNPQGQQAQPGQDQYQQNQDNPQNQQNQQNPQGQDQQNQDQNRDRSNPPNQ